MFSHEGDGVIMRGKASKVIIRYSFVLVLETVHGHGPDGPRKEALRRYRVFTEPI